MLKPSLKQCLADAWLVLKNGSASSTSYSYCILPLLLQLNSPFFSSGLLSAMQSRDPLRWKMKTTATSTPQVFTVKGYAHA
jgi:hypothetical protein